MINQGERIEFKGTFEQKAGDTWITMDLSDYAIDALVLNEATNRKFLFSSSSLDNPITINPDNNTYIFNITPEQSAAMIGECILEISLKDQNGNPIISDNKGKFVINESLLGRTLSKQ